jgi:hypothetical protein
VYLTDDGINVLFVLQQEILEMLVEAGADLDSKTKNGETPFGEFFRAVVISRLKIKPCEMKITCEIRT